MSIVEQEARSDRYQVIPRVLIFPFNESGEVLLLHGAPTKNIWRSLWNGIGGHIEAGETILNATKRELFEETGFKAKNLILCGQVMVDVGSAPGIAIFIFKAEGMVGEMHLSDEGELAWIKIKDLSDISLVEDLHTILPKVIKFNKGDVIFYGVYTYNASDQLMMSFE